MALVARTKIVNGMLGHRKKKIISLQLARQHCFGGTGVQEFMAARNGGAVMHPPKKGNVSTRSSFSHGVGSNTKEFRLFMIVHYGVRASKMLSLDRRSSQRAVIRVIWSVIRGKK